MLLEDILNNLKTYPNSICCKHDKFYTNHEFYEIVCKIYTLIKDAPKDRPIVVYGHKEVYMIASFLACSFLGIAYVPIDRMCNKERTKSIIAISKPSYIIGNINLVDDLECSNISFEQIASLTNFEEIGSIAMKPDDTYYILFTSGTTGVPKGVVVSYTNIDSCVNWLKDVTSLKGYLPNYTMYNQAVFSFDLSVADTYLSLATGACHYIGVEFSALNCKSAYDDLKNANPNIMVLTPSQAELYCIDNSFNEELMPNLEIIIFCGEKLTKKLVAKLYNRFSKTKIINMYGPTECTYAVTSIEVSRDNISEEIPIGFAKKDVKLYIVDNLIEKQDGEVGEILISGASVAKGYLNFKNDDKFILYNGMPSYLTGDLGYKKGDLFYYVSRNDTQVKFKGYRIELLDIENNIAQIDGVNSVKVKAEKGEDGEIKRIVALVVLEDNSFMDSVKETIKNKLPKYMIPQLKFVDVIPININGKFDI